MTAALIVLGIIAAPFVIWGLFIAAGIADRKAGRNG